METFRGLKISKTGSEKVFTRTKMLSIFFYPELSYLILPGFFLTNSSQLLAPLLTFLNTELV